MNLTAIFLENLKANEVAINQSLTYRTVGSKVMEILYPGTPYMKVDGVRIMLYQDKSLYPKELDVVVYPYITSKLIFQITLMIVYWYLLSCALVFIGSRIKSKMT